MGRSNQNMALLIIILLAGVIIGGFIGEYAGRVPYMGWLNYGNDPFGLIQPFVLNLGIIKVQFGFEIKFTIAGIIGLVLSIFAYKRLL